MCVCKGVNSAGGKTEGGFLESRELKRGVFVMND